MMDYHCHSMAVWTQRRNGTAHAAEGTVAIPFSAPPEFHGEDGKWTPEHFFAAAIASCFVTTFRAIAELSKFAYAGLRVTVEAILEHETGGYRFTRVVVQPELSLHNETQREQGVRLLDKAERACLISRSIRSQIELRPTITISATQSNLPAV